MPKRSSGELFSCDSMPSTKADYIRECAESGKHYIDLTGESTWLARDIIPKYNYLASKTGACIVPSCGVDSIPSSALSPPTPACEIGRVADTAVIWRSTLRYRSSRPPTPI